MEVENLYHPLIENPVANSISARGGILVTGSNASGKSTFLKNIAINSIFAQTIYTCTATSYCAPYFQVMTSMRYGMIWERRELLYCGNPLLKENFRCG